jgi:hypothetical protein
MPSTKVVEDTILYRKRVINGILDYIRILKILMPDPLVYSQTTVHGKAQNVPWDGTKRLLDLCAMGRHKMCHGTAQNGPQHGTKRLLDLND